MTRYSPQWLQSQSYAASQDRRLLGALWPAPASSGCTVTAGSGMTVNVSAGQVAVPTSNATGTSLCSSDANEVVTVTAAAAQDRIDLIICRPRGADLGISGGEDFIFDVVTGTPAASPVPPATPPGTVALAQVRVPTGSASVTAGNITDVRPAGLSLAVANPRGKIAGIIGPASTVTAAAANTTVVSLSPTVTAGRLYRAYAFCLGTSSAAAEIRLTLLGTDRSQTRFADIFGTPAGGIAGAATSAVITPSLTGALTVTLQAFAASGTFSINPGSAELYIDDIGIP